MQAPVDNTKTLSSYQSYVRHFTASRNSANELLIKKKKKKSRKIRKINIQ